jgi:hypothetical protein
MSLDEYEQPYISPESQKNLSMDLPNNLFSLAVLLLFFVTLPLIFRGYVPEPKLTFSLSYIVIIFVIFPLTLIYRQKTDAYQSEANSKAHGSSWRLTFIPKLQLFAIFVAIANAYLFARMIS